MCIIAIKQQGKSMWTEKELKTMWDNNPHGAGYMFSDGKRVHIRKGFMAFKGLLESLKELETEIDVKEKALVLHFRITTHGGTSASNTHPFPISNVLSDLQSTDVETDIGVCHNGIISKFSPGYQAKHSDTMEYIKSQLFYIKRMNKNFYKDKYALDLISKAITSKMAFLDVEETVTTIGDFQFDEEGRSYSNGTFTQATYAVYHYPYDRGSGDVNDYDGYYDSYYHKNSYYKGTKQTKTDISASKAKAPENETVSKKTYSVRGANLYVIATALKKLLKLDEDSCLSVSVVQKLNDNTLTEVPITLFGKEFNAHKFSLSAGGFVYRMNKDFNTFTQMKDTAVYYSYLMEDGTEIEEMLDVSRFSKDTSGFFFGEKTIQVLY